MIERLKRPNFGKRQVRTIRGIKPRRFYLEIYRGFNNGWLEPNGRLLKTDVVLLKSERFPHGDALYFEAQIYSKIFSEFFSQKFFLSDSSILPYEHEGLKVWNQVNFLARTRAKTLKGACSSLKKFLEKIADEKIAD